LLTGIWWFEEIGWTQRLKFKRFYLVYGDNGQKESRVRTQDCWIISFSQR